MNRTTRDSNLFWIICCFGEDTVSLQILTVILALMWPYQECGYTGYLLPDTAVKLSQLEYEWNIRLYMLHLSWLVLVLLVFTDGPRPSQKEIISLRAFMLLFLKQLILKVGSLGFISMCSLIYFCSILAPFSPFSPPWHHSLSFTHSRTVVAGTFCMYLYTSYIYLM